MMDSKWATQVGDRAVRLREENVEWLKKLRKKHKMCQTIKNH